MGGKMNSNLNYDRDKQPGISLDLYFDKLLGKQSEGDLLSGRNARIMWEIIGNENLTRLSIASFFWLTFISSPKFSELVINSVGLKTVDFYSLEKIVVIHGDYPNRYNLLVLHRNIDLNKPFVISELEFSSSDIEEIQDVLFFQKGFTRSRQSSFFPNLQMLSNIGSSLLKETVSNYKFGIIFDKLPDMETTAWIPYKSLGFSKKKQPIDYFATVGVIALDQYGEYGVTTSLHAFDPPPSIGSRYYIEEIGYGVVKSIDVISDSCFLLIERNSTKGKKIKGPLFGVSPRINDLVWFEGKASGFQNTNVSAFDPGIPILLDPYNQQKIYTHRVTDQCDSGASLIDIDDNVLGFAFMRTGLQSGFNYSTWIWAESVFRAHVIS